jgi:serine/threonine protein kinase
MTLSKYLSRSLAGSLFVFVTIAQVQALQAVHKREIIHQDIKLRNFIINPHTRTVKLCDFRCAVP